MLDTIYNVIAGAIIGGALGYMLAAEIHRARR